MIKLNAMEALFMPEDGRAEEDEWIAEMEAQGFVLWDTYAPVCRRVRFVPPDMAGMVRGKRQADMERARYVDYESEPHLTRMRR